MRLSSLFIAAALASAPAVVLAQTAPAITPAPGKILISSDGKRIGPIDRIVLDASGAPRSAAVIYDARFVYVPYESLGAGENGRVTTSLTQKAVRALH